MMGRFMQYYREHARYLERTYDFVERIGIGELQRLLVEDGEGICAGLDAAVQAAVDAFVDPWQEGTAPVHPLQFTTVVNRAPAERGMSAIATQYALGPLDNIPLGEARVFRVDGRDIAVFRCRSGEVFATSAECPHRGGPLADGLVGEPLGHLSAARLPVRSSHRRSDGARLRSPRRRIASASTPATLTLDLA